MIPDGDLLVRFRPLLYLHARHLLLGRLYQAGFDASDIVSETCVRALRALDQVRGRSEPEFVQWLRKILENIVKDLIGDVIRKPNNHLPYPWPADADERDPLGTYIAASGPGPSTVAGKQEELLRLAGAIKQLPEVEQDAVIGHHILELRVAEIAVRLGRTEKAVAGVLCRAKKRLRELLERGATHDPR
jgi:RNA polymerase sigma-70 factor (ECF subfamily)